MVTKTRQPVYIITGPLFLDKKIKKIGKRGVLVPTHVYKVVYYPTLKVASAYISVNDETARTDVSSINQLQQYSGINFFPAMAQSSLLNQRYALPLSANSAYKLKDFKLLNGGTNIFSIMPSYSTATNKNIQNEVKSKLQDATKQRKAYEAELKKRYDREIKYTQDIINSVF